MIKDAILKVSNYKQEIEYLIEEFFRVKINLPKINTTVVDSLKYFSGFHISRQQTTVLY